MLFDISKQKLPKVYKRKGKKYYLDPVRKKLVQVTPEETVRQRMISYLIDILNVPQEMIRVEAHLSHYGIKSKRRADIIIHGVDDKNIVVPIAAVECKASNVILGAAAANQLTDYCDLLGCDYAMMVNAHESFTYYYNEQSDKYIQVESLPQYEEMLKGKYTTLELGELPERILYEDIPSFIQENLPLDIGMQTEHQMKCVAFNLLEGLLDPRHKLPIKKYKLFDLIEDYGVRLLSYGNASGGVFNGFYRSFIIEVNGNTEFVSIGLSTYITHARPDTEKTSLNIAIDNEKESHHSLQLVLDDNVEIDRSRVHFYHHGKIGVSNLGSGKVDDLRNLIEEKCSSLISGKRFYLGSLTNNRNWNLDDAEVICLIENLISYALLRDEYREQVKRKLVNSK